MTINCTRVGDLAEQIRGVTYNKEDASQTPLPGYLPILRAGNITDAGLHFNDLVYVPATKISASFLAACRTASTAASVASA